MVILAPFRATVGPNRLTMPAASTTGGAAGARPSFAGAGAGVTARSPSLISTALFL